MNNLRHAYNLWKNHSESMAMSEALNQEKKRFVVESLANYAKSNSNQNLRAVLRKFRDNSTRGGILYRIFK